MIDYNRSSFVMSGCAAPSDEEGIGTTEDDEQVKLKLN